MEASLIQWLRQNLPQGEQVLVGLGDDAAVLRGPQNLVVTTDMLMDGVDFVLREVDPRRVGRKSLAVNLSDLAAMAARPVAAFVSLCLPRSGGLALAQALYEGLLPLAKDYNVSIAGGDTNSWDGPLVINVTLLGEAASRGPLLRCGARPGDRILVTGPLGNSLAGQHFDFTPRVWEALALHERYLLHAGADISDGLSLDLSHLMEESSLGAILDTAAIPLSPGATLEQALTDGEDFELVLAVPPDEAARMLSEQPLATTQLHDIGEFAASPGLWLRDPFGAKFAFQPRGYEHRLEP